MLLTLTIVVAILFVSETNSIVTARRDIHMKKCRKFSSQASNTTKYFIKTSDSNTFSLDQIESELPCRTDRISTSVNVQSVNESKDGIFINVGSGANFTSHGQLRHGDEYYNVEEYCVKGITKDDMSIDICKSTCGQVRCIPKCCTVGKSILITNNGPGGCSNSGPVSWSPTIYKNPYTKLTSDEIENSQLRSHYVLTRPNCSFNLWPLKNLFYSEFTLKKVPWRFLSDGSLVYLAAQRSWTKLPTNTNYCIDGIINQNSNENYTGHELDQALLVCYEETEVKQNSLSYLYVAAMLFASIFLLLTAVVYILLWEQHTVHGWTVLSLVVSMFFMYILLTAAHILADTRTDAEESESKLCIGTGILAHFFFLSSFCWMTLLNFDLFWTFRSLRPQGSGKSKGLKRFFFFLIFAWSIPVTVIITGLVLNSEYPDIESEIIVPEYGLTACFINGPAMGPYLYYIIGTLLACNLILICITLSGIYRLQESTKIIVHNKSTSQQSLKLFAKLFVIMGVTWIFEFISWFDTDKSIPWYWVVVDMINMLQAFAIFIIFICKRKIWVQLQMKYTIIQKIAPKCLRMKNKSNDNKKKDAENKRKVNGTDLEQNSSNNSSRSASTKQTDDNAEVSVTRF